MTTHCINHCTTNVSAPAMHHLDSPFVQANRSLVVIDRGAEDYQQLLAGVVPGAQVLLVSQEEDGIEQISRAIAQTSPSTIHLIAHGAPGCLYLGNSELSLDTLPAHRAALSQWFQEAENPQLVIYGCRVAAGDAGEELVQKLHHITGAGVSAATGAIGAASQGGSWTLDVQVASSSTVPLALTPATQKSYAGVLEWVIAEKEVSIDVPPPDALLQNDLISNEQFGEAVSIFGDYAVVGIPFDDPVNNDLPNDPANGAVYVYQQIGGDWTPIQRLTVPPEALAESVLAGTSPLISQYGAAVAITEIAAVGGGTTARLLVGDPTGVAFPGGPAAGGVPLEAGRVYVYDINPTTGLFDLAPQRLQASPAGGAGNPNAVPISFDSFGASLATSGNFIVVGAPTAEAPTANIVGDLPPDAGDNAGAVYVFELVNGVWQLDEGAPRLLRQEAAISTGPLLGNDRFGTSVAIDGDTIIVGAPFREASGATPQPAPVLESGAAYIYTRNPATGAWDQPPVELRGPDLLGLEQNDNNQPQFGQSVSISGDFAIVGAPGANLTNLGDQGVDAGKAYIYERQANGVWLLAREITASDASALDEFGFSVSISGEFAIVGAPTAGDNELDGTPQIGSGSSYILQRNAETGIWEEVEAITSAEISSEPVVPPGNNDPLNPPSIVDGRIINPPDNSTPFGRPSIVAGEVVDLDRTFGQSVSIFKDPDTNSPQALVGAPTDVAVLGQDDTTGQVQDIEVPIQPDPAVDGPAREPDDRDDVQAAGSVYFLRTRPEVIDVVFSAVANGATIPEKVSPRGPERSEDFFASDGNVVDGYSITIVYNESMDPDNVNNQPAVSFVAPTIGTNFGTPTGQWISVNGGTNNAYVLTYPLADQNVEIENIDLEIRGARSVAGVEQTEATRVNKDFLGDAFDIETKNPLVTLTPIQPNNLYFNSGPFVVNAAFDEAVTFSNGASPFSVTNIFNDPGDPSNPLNPVFADASQFGITLGVTPASEGLVSIGVDPGAVFDRAGNLNETSLVIERIFDATPPAVESLTATDLAGNPITGPTNAPFRVTALFNEAISPGVLNFDSNDDVDFATNNAFITDLQQPDPNNGKLFTFTVNPNVATQVGDITLSLGGDITDFAFNPLQQPSLPLTVSYDGEAPTVTLVGPAQTVVEDVFTVTATFSEPLTAGSFQTFGTPTTPEDVSVAGGTIQSIVDVTAPGSTQPTYEITIAPDIPGPIDISVIGGAATDIAGNANTASNPVQVTYIPPVNMPPVITLPEQADDPATESLVVQGDSQLVFSAANNTAITVLDPDAGPTNILEMAIALESPDPAFNPSLLGSLSLANPGSVTFLNPGPGNDGVDDTTISVEGTQSELTAILEGLTFNPSNLDADVTLRVTVNDRGFTGAPPSLPEFDTKTLTIDIERVISPAEHDFDNNGISDIVWQDGNGDNFVWFLENTPTGINLIQQGNPFTLPAGKQTRGSSDFNGDGTPDLVLQDANGQVSIFRTTVDQVAPFDITGVEVPVTVPPASAKDASWSIVGVGDFGGPVSAPPDSRVQSDIVWRNSITGQVSIWYMDGETFDQEVAIVGPTIRDQNWQIEAVGDFNGDGSSDLMWRNSALGRNLLWTMNGATVIQGQAVDPVSTDWTIAGSGDYNGDQRADIVWRNQTTGQNAIWFMDGATVSQRLSLTSLAPPAQIVHN